MYRRRKSGGRNRVEALDREDASLPLLSQAFDGSAPDCRLPVFDPTVVGKIVLGQERRV
jgi:hypothetical protein